MSKHYRCDWCRKERDHHPNYEFGCSRSTHREHYCSRLCASKGTYRFHILYDEKDRTVKDAYYAGPEYAEYKAAQVATR